LSKTKLRQFNSVQLRRSLRILIVRFYMEYNTGLRIAFSTFSCANATLQHVGYSVVSVHPSL